MELTGGCYCGAVRYAASGEPVFKDQCHCRRCLYFSGGNPNVVIAMPADGFAFTEGEPKTFRHPEPDRPIVRAFCGDCGTHLTGRSSRNPGTVTIKVGTFDDPTHYDGPDAAIYTEDMLAFHQIPDGCTMFARDPERRRAAGG
jgi:hypothetical protein